MIAFLARVLGLIITLLGVVTLIFLILRAIPGDPASAMLGPDATAEQLEELREQLGLNLPLPLQYVAYLSDAVRLNFGDSIRLGEPAIEVVLERFPATVQLTVAATIIAIIAGITLGMIAGWREGGRLDTAISTGSIALQSTPTFWVGIMLVLVFALWLRVLPSAGDGSPLSLILPAVTLSIPFTGIVARITRASVAETMSSLYVQTARSKGLSEWNVLQRHVLRNSLIPVVTIVALQVGALVGGAVVVENVFAWPGLGSLIVSSIGNRDYPVVQAATVFIAVVVIVLNLIADLSYRIIDPRIGSSAS